MENRPRILTICSFSYDYGCNAPKHPGMLIKGKWLREFGFEIGDQVTITNPEPCSMLIVVTKTAAVMQLERDQREEEIQLMMIKLRRKAA